MNNTKLEKMQNIQTGNGIQFLLNEAYAILGNPILMHDLDFKLMACTENIITDDPLWNELVTTGRHSDETLQHFKEEGYFDIVANTIKITLLSSDKIKYDRLFGKIFNIDHVHVACVDVVACHNPFDDDDPAAFEELCDLLTMEISRSKSYQEYGKIYQETIISQLIDGNIPDKELYSVYVVIINNGLKDTLYLAAADISRCSPELSPVYLRDLLKKTQPEFKYAIYGKYIVFIISTDNVEINIKEDLNNLEQLFRNNDIRAGVSRPFDNLYELSKHYQEAVDALNAGMESGGDQRIFL